MKAVFYCPCVINTDGLIQKSNTVQNGESLGYSISGLYAMMASVQIDADVGKLLYINCEIAYQQTPNSIVCTWYGINNTVNVTYLSDSLQNKTVTVRYGGYR